MQRKRDHGYLTPKCKNPGYGACDYGKRCWFRYEKNEIKINEVNSTNEVTEKIFNIMEKFTKRIIE